MTKLLLLLAIGFLSLVHVQAQDPAIEWQNTIGGSDGDFMSSMEPTADGGYILGGFSSSNASGDKTENSNGGTDIWIVKIDATGNIQWQNTIGGSGDDYGLTTKPTSDGGYIVMGASDSNISGDKTENSRGGLDYWILKLDSSGSITWQHTYGGAQPDFEAFGEQTSDGGYIVGGYSDSNISGDKTDPSNGQRDFWILKLDNNGDIVWQNSIGGSMVDEVLMTHQTTDGGYIIGGFSDSPVSGDKSEPSEGMRDYWIVKLDTNGSIQWENTIGGDQNDLVRDIIQTNDGGYLVGGYSKSNISGDKSENSQGDFDYWIVKLDTNGVLVWENTIGGSEIDYPRDVIQLTDGTYMVAGWSNSNISGDKTIDSNGGYDYWLVKLNSAGTLISQNSIGGSGDESGTYIYQLADGNFIMGCSSDSNISGDKGDNSEGMDDYWVLKAGSEILGVESNEIGTSLKVYPNPFNDKLFIDSESTITKVSVRDVLGRRIFGINSASENIEEINLSSTSKGMYFITLTSDTNQSKTIKLIKK